MLANLREDLEDYLELTHLFLEKTEKLHKTAGKKVFNVEFPHEIKQAHRERTYKFWYDLVLEIANFVSDFVFLFVLLKPLAFPSEDTVPLVLSSEPDSSTSSDTLFFRQLFYVSAFSLGATVLMRLLLPLLVIGNTKYFQKWLYGCIWMIFEPREGVRNLKLSFKPVQNLATNLIGQSAGHQFKDEIASRAKNNMIESEMNSFLGLMFLIQDVPQLIVETLLINKLGGDLELAFWIALVTSSTHTFLQFAEAVNVIKDLPGLNNLRLARSMVFNGSKDAMSNLRKYARVDFQQPSFLVRARKAYFSFQTTVEKSLVREGEFFKVISENSVKRKTGPWRKVRTFFTEICGPIFSLVLAPVRFVFYDSVNRLFTHRLASSSLLLTTRELDLSSSDCPEEDFETLGEVCQNLPCITSLKLAFCWNLKDAALLTIPKTSFHALETLVLDSTQITDEGLGLAIEVSKRNLRHLSLRDLPDVTDTSLELMGKHLGNLEVLHIGLTPGTIQLSDKQGVTNAGLKELARGCGNTLAVLTVDYQTRIKEDGVKAFLTLSSKYMRHVSFNGLKVGDDVCKLMVEKKPLLTHIGLCDTLVQGAGVQELAKLVHLKRLFLSGTKGIYVQKDLRALWTKCHELQQVAFTDPREVLLYQMSLFERHVGRIRRLQNPKIEDEELNEFFQSEFLEDAEKAMEGLKKRISSGLEGEALTLKTREVVAIHDFIRRLFLRYLSRNGDATLNKILTTKEEKSYYREARHRYPKEELKQYLAEYKQDDFKGVQAALNRLKAADLQRDIGKATKFPYPCLAPFSTLPSSDVNLKVDMDKNEYETLSHESFRQHERNHSQGKGKITPLARITLADRESRKEASKNFNIPMDAEYYCFAYPVKGATDVQYFDNLDFKDALSRLRAFGGYLYFDKNRHFLSISALTVGSKFAYHGPFAISSDVVQYFEKKERWHDTTVGYLEMEDGTPTQFTWVYPEEKHLLSQSLKGMLAHGGFAYRKGRIDGNGVKMYDRTGYIFTMAGPTEIEPVVETDK